LSDDPSKNVRQKLAFDALGLSPRMLGVLNDVQYVKPTPVQAGMIPLVLQGKDVVGQARTGTGKTAAFAIPLIDQWAQQHDGRVRGLVLVPTRELAVQVQQEVSKLSAGTKLTCTAIYGGHSVRTQLNALKRGVDIVVGTPGRVIDHLQRKSLILDHLKCVVLDEADRMLDIGFRPDIERILRRCPTERQTLLLSATMPGPIIALAKRYMRRPVRVNFSSRNLAHDTIEQSYFMVPDTDKVRLLLKLLEREQPRQCIIFCRTKLGTQKLFLKLTRHGLPSVRAIHGDLSQPQRDSVMKDFRAGNVQVLVATDVVGRGIDVTDISHIINFDVPELCDDYVHRVGRTGRMGRSGVAFTFVTQLQRSELADIEKRIGRSLQRDHIEGLSLSEDQQPSTVPGRGGRGGKRRIRRAL
jgi:ATP-dependent RNA helicase DeaD